MQKHFNEESFGLTEDLAKRIQGGGPVELLVESPSAGREVVAALAGRARCNLDILSHDLEPLLYDTVQFIDAVRALCLRTRRARVRVMLQDSSLAVKEGHRLVSLSQRLTTCMQIRKLPASIQEITEAFLIVDEAVVMQRMLANAFRAQVSTHARARARELLTWFNSTWEHAVADPELKRLYL